MIQKHKAFKLIDHPSYLVNQLSPKRETPEATSYNCNHKIISLAKSQQLKRVKSSFSGPNSFVQTQEYQPFQVPIDKESVSDSKDKSQIVNEFESQLQAKCMQMLTTNMCIQKMNE